MKGNSGFVDNKGLLAPMHGNFNEAEFARRKRRITKSQAEMQNLSGWADGPSDRFGLQAAVVIA